MDNMTKEESYADRRQLFKNIWETAMQIDEKDVDNLMGKPKVIKTLRLDEVDRCVIGKRKKERIKNLRTVCKKILDFCDRQDADDICFEQKPKVIEISDDEASPQNKLEPNKKIKTYHRRKKVKRVKTLYAPKKSSRQQATSERMDDYPTIFTNSSRNDTPNMRNAFNFVQRASVTERWASNPDAEGSNALHKESATRRKVLRKRLIKRKKSTAPNMTSLGPSGASNNVHYLSPTITGRVIVKHIRQFLTDNEIVVTSQVIHKTGGSVESSLCPQNIISVPQGIKNN